MRMMSIEPAGSTFARKSTWVILLIAVLFILFVQVSPYPGDRDIRIIICVLIGGCLLMAPVISTRVRAFLYW